MYFYYAVKHPISRPNCFFYHKYSVIMLNTYIQKKTFTAVNIIHRDDKLIKVFVYFTPFFYLSLLSSSSAGSSSLYPVQCILMYIYH